MDRHTENRALQLPAGYFHTDSRQPYFESGIQRTERLQPDTELSADKGSQRQRIFQTGINIPSDNMVWRTQKAGYS